MSAAALTLAQLERRMSRIMIEVDERAATSIGNVLERATFAELVGAPHHSPGKKEEEEQEDEVDDTPEPAPPDGGGGGDNNCSAGEPRAAPRARGALRMDFASCYLPDHDEDAHFGHAKAGFVGVADGVGGYRDKGVDAGAFARALMKHALAAAKQAAATKRGRRNINQPVVTPHSLLQRAYIKAARERATGASTAAVVSLRGGRTLRWGYVGDSGFAVLRGGKTMAHWSAPQQHRFNRPYQLRAGGGGGDRVADAAVGEVPVAEGDVVVVGTDGLFDNVFDAELEWVVRAGTELGLSPQGMADKLAAVARKMSRRSTPSPFSVESSRHVKDGKRPHYGGKEDDITVVVAYIVSKNS